MQFLKNLSSPVLAGIIGLILVLFSVSVAAMTLRDFAELLVMVFYPETPLSVFIIVTAVFICWTAYAGFEVIARMAQFMLPLVLFGILFSGLPTISKVNVQHFRPLLEEGLYPVIRGGITHWAFFGDTVVWFLLLPHLNQNVKSYTFLPVSVVMAGGLLVLILVLITNGLGTGIAAEENYPFLSLTRTVSLAGFVERIESVFLLIWVAVGFIKITVFFYAALFGISQYFQLNKQILVILPLMVVTIALSLLLFDNYHEFRSFFRPEIYAVIVSIVQVFIPLVLVIIWLIKTRV